MPWSKAQKRTAQAVAHGWKSKGEAKGFTRDFAQQVISESEASRKRKIRKHFKAQSTE